MSRWWRLRFNVKLWSLLAVCVTIMLFLNWQLGMAYLVGLPIVFLSKHRRYFYVYAGFAIAMTTFFVVMLVLRALRLV